jgi:hypothetical protein
MSELKNVFGLVASSKFKSKRVNSGVLESDVRFGSKADIATNPRDVSLTLNNGHRADMPTHLL